jgi:hypothetical protein
MACEVEFTDEFGEWWDDLTGDEQESVRAYVKLLEDYGTALKHPYSSSVETSKHSQMRELRVQHRAVLIESYTRLIPGEPRFF